MCASAYAHLQALPTTCSQRSWTIVTPYAFWLSVDRVKVKEAAHIAIVVILTPSRLKLVCLAAEMYALRHLFHTVFAQVTRGQMIR